MRRLLAVAAVLGCVSLCARPAVAQEPSTWEYSYSPYGYYSSVDGWWLAGYFRYYSRIGFRERPEPYRAAFTLTGGASTRGSYLVDLDAQAPALWDGWRAGVSVTAARANRLGYYGTGNGSTYDADSATAQAPFFYRTSRMSQLVRLTLQRRVVGPLRALAGATIEHTSYRELPGDNLFRRDAVAGVVDSAPPSDAAVRGGLILDSRDNELDPHAGVYVEALYASGKHYTRTTVNAQGYVHPLERLMFAARVAGEKMTGTPGLSLQQSIEDAGRPFIAVGGYRSLRGYCDSRFTGPGKLIGGVEARWAVFWAPSLIELKLVAFYDVGRVFAPGEKVRLTSAGLHKSGGGEVMARLGRNTILVFGAGFGSDGGQFLFGTTWSY
jgi:outer membrane protein assembly factor BamA